MQGDALFEERALTLEQMAALAEELSVERASACIADGRGVVRANGLRALAVLAAPDPAMVPMLCDSDAEVAAAAADALAHLGARVAAWIPAITRALARARMPVRERMLEALAALVGTADDAFIAALDDSPSQVSDAVVEALVRAGQKGVTLLARALLQEKTLVRYNSARALSRLADDGVFAALGVDQEILATLVEVRDTDDASDVRSAADEALAKVVATAHLLSSKAAARAAAEAAEIAIPGFTERALSREELGRPMSETERARVLRALHDGRDHVRANAAYALGSLGADQGGDSVRPISILLRDEQASVRRAAASALGWLGRASTPVCDALVRALGDADADVARAAEAALRGLGDEARAALVRGLDLPAGVHAVRVLDLLFALPDADDVLCQAFSSPSVQVQVNAALGLGLLGRGRGHAGRQLLETARTSGEAATRKAVRQALAMLAEPEPAPPAIDIPGFGERALGAEDIDATSIEPASLMAALADPRPFARVNAATALGTLGQEAADSVLLLAVLLRDSELEVALSAARALAALGPAVGPRLGAIVRTVERAHPVVREQVLATLTALVDAAGDAFLDALDAPADHGQELVVEILLRAGPSGALALARALDQGKTLQRYHSAVAVARAARRGVLLAPDVEQTVLQALARVQQVEDAPDVRRAATAAATAVIAARLDESARAAERAARENADVAIPGFAERAMSIEELVSSASPGHEAQVRNALRDGRSTVRANAARALAALGAQAGDVVHPLAVLLRDSDPSVRQASVSALGWLSRASTPVADALVHALGDADADVSRAAEAVLRDLGDDALPALARGLETDDRGAAVRVLGLVLVHDRAPALLAEWFANGSDNLRVNAALGLGMLGRERAGAHAALLEAARTGGDARTRAAVREALTTLAPPAPEGPPPIDVPGFDERLLAADELAPGSISVDSVLAAARDGRPFSRANAATLFGHLGARARPDIFTLAVLLRDAEPVVRRAAARALERLTDVAVDIVDALVHALGDRDAEVADSAAATLGAMGEAAAPALVRALDTDDDTRSRRLLTLIAPLPDAAGMLFEAFRTPALHVQINAAHGLASLARDRVSEHIIDVLDDEQWFGDLRKRRAVRRALNALAG